jgi:hypothetical protein
MADLLPQPGPPQGRERRRHPRFPTHNRVLGTLLVHKLPVRVRDVSQGGFSVETAQPLGTGAVEPVRFTAIDDWSAVLEARSVDCRPSISSDGLPLFVTGYAFTSETSADDVATLLQKVTSVDLREA